MHEAAQHRRFIKSLYSIIQSDEPESERSVKVEDAIASYAAALNEVADTPAPRRPKRNKTGYVDGHLSSVLNQIRALRNLDMVDDTANRVCEVAMHAIESEKQKLGLSESAGR